MIKIKFIDLIKEMVGGHDKTMRFHPVVIEHAISTAYNEMLVKTFTKDLYDLGLFTKTFGDAGTPIAVTQNLNTLEYYSLLPSEIVPLPYINGGVKKIKPLQDSSMVFAPMRSCDIGLIEGLECQTIDDVIGFTSYSDKVIYTGMTTAIATAGVVMELVIPFHAYADDDVINFPKGQESTLINMVLTQLGVVPMKDLTNNNSDIKQNKQ